MTQTTDTAEPIEASHELEVYEPQPPTTLFHTDDPDLALQRMGRSRRRSST